jgi:hypothetical protein
MTCGDHDLTVMDIARGVPVDGGAREAALSHARECPRCAALLRDQQALSRGLRAMAADVEIPASAGLERRLVERIREDRDARSEPLWQTALKVAAAVILVAAALVGAWRDLNRAQRPAPPPRAPEFVLWPGAAALPPFESGELVRTELPVSALPVLGIEAPANPAASRVKADLLVGQDGLVRAVRLAN